jgi:hypothetical protein
VFQGLLLPVAIALVVYLFIVLVVFGAVLAGTGLAGDRRPPPRKGSSASV